MWVRGLKHLRIVHDTKGWQASHPVWVRGLKLRYRAKGSLGQVSHPVWVRGLKHVLVGRLQRQGLSHPVWVRGLKHDRD